MHIRATSEKYPPQATHFSQSTSLHRVALGFNRTAAWRAYQHHGQPLSAQSTRPVNWIDQIHVVLNDHDRLDSVSFTLMTRFTFYLCLIGSLYLSSFMIQTYAFKIALSPRTVI